MLKFQYGEMALALGAIVAATIVAGDIVVGGFGGLAETAMLRLPVTEIDVSLRNLLLCQIALQWWCIFFRMVDWLTGGWKEEKVKG